MRLLGNRIAGIDIDMNKEQSKLVKLVALPNETDGNMIVDVTLVGPDVKNVKAGDRILVSVRSGSPLFMPMGFGRLLYEPEVICILDKEEVALTLVN